MTLEITDSNIQELISEGSPLVVDFWAPWCGPCQMMGPVVAEIAEEHPEYKVCKVNVDEQQELGMQFNVMSIPFFAVFKEGKLTNSTVGAQSKESLIDLLK